MSSDISDECHVMNQSGAAGQWHNDNFTL